MVMDKKRRTSSLATTSDHDEPQSSSENGPDSPLSGDDVRANVSTPAHLSVKKRRSIKKKVVYVKIGEMEGSRSKGEAYPPSDSWAWRKYGQKPIKGSPYPRGYYRCSSFKGCPARKQVERNRMDPSTLVITYAYDHNHPLPAAKHQPPPPAASPPTPSARDAPDCDPSSSSSPVVEVNNPFGNSTDDHLEFVRDSSILGSLGIEYSWMSDVSYQTPSLVGPSCDDAELAAYSMREEDEPLFGDLGELPECSIVFQKRDSRSIETLCGSNG